MIPVKLNLSNFTSYGESVPELDFTKFHMAAISGQNGAGKSSLLDAITWCVWGSSRLGDASDSLVRLGQTLMFVEFSFELDGHVFTIKRQRILKGGGSTTLEFLSNKHNLTEGTIKATQQKIIDTLHLTYETFTNSAYLRQGHADEFTTKGPTERKRILADILGLSHYDLLEEKAKEKVKDAQAKLQVLGYQLIEIEAELSQKEEREKELSLAEKEAEEAEIKIREIEAEIKLIEAEKQTVSVKLTSLKEAEGRLKAAQKELEDLKAQISLKETASEEYQKILSQKVEIEENFKLLQNLNEEKQFLEGKRSELIKVKDELVSVQKVIAERDTKRNKTISDLQVEKQKLETEKEKLEEQNKSLKEKKDVCPTCNQAIDKQKNAEIEKQNLEIINKNTLSLKELDEKITKYQSFVFPEITKATELEKQVKSLEEETKDYQDLVQKISSLSLYENLNLKLQQAETAVKAHQEAVSDLKKIYQKKEEQTKKETEALKDLDQEKIRLEEVQNRLQAKESVKNELGKQALELRGKVGAAKQLVSRAKQLEDLQQQRNKEKETFQKEKEIYEELAQAFGKKGIQAMIIETAIPEIEEETNRLLDKLTEGRMRVSLETQRETKSKIAGTGEKGIVETLDIVISDEMGQRPYEGFSGGEQFRVNFAIRLALSKLLTHRAGAKLQFLVIDEGFGTQDAQGRGRIVEALNVIKDEFEKILIITHLEELKEEFPARIEVNKGPAGSTFVQ